MVLSLKYHVMFSVKNLSYYFYFVMAIDMSPLSGWQKKFEDISWRSFIPSREIAGKVDRRIRVRLLKLDRTRLSWHVANFPLTINHILVSF